jgi:hypothetical protein
MELLKILIQRLDKIGIKLELIGNYPWVYLDKVNSKKVTEKYQSDWGFVIGYRSIRLGDVNMFTFTELKEIFRVIRSNL